MFLFFSFCLCRGMFFAVWAGAWLGCLYIKHATGLTAINIKKHAPVQTAHKKTQPPKQQKRPVTRNKKRSSLLALNVPEAV